MLAQKELPTQEELRNWAVSIVDDLNNELEPFNANMVMEALVRIQLDLAEMGEEAISGENERFVIYKLMSITKEALEWKRQASMIRFSKESLS